MPRRKAPVFVGNYFTASEADSLTDNASSEDIRRWVPFYCDKAAPLSLDVERDRKVTGFIISDEIGGSPGRDQVPLRTFCLRGGNFH